MEVERDEGNIDTDDSSYEDSSWEPTAEVLQVNTKPIKQFGHVFK